MNSVIHLEKISKIYNLGGAEVRALDEVTLTVNKGEFVAIMGASGSGKSTMMNIIGCLDKPTEGQYYFEQTNISDFDKNEYAEFRNKKIGFIFQGFNLLPRTTAIENVEVPLLYSSQNKMSIAEIQDKSAAILKKLGLGDRLHHVPSQLSGGQQQRVAISRALINDPMVLIADEPTGNLDTKTSHEIMMFFRELNANGITVVMVTHEDDIANYAKRKVVMRDGQVIEDVLNISMTKELNYENI